MLNNDSSNTIFQLATDLVCNTSQHVFLTGKAGTGKTTFLKHVREQTTKNTVVVAPTGVAAINAGGVTMHSFFQLPRGVFVPDNIPRETMHGAYEINDRHSLFKNIHFTSNKRQLLEELELLIIDEVSMVRCDMLDAIDLILKHFRKAQHLSFGGVQVVYIGDLYQLAPVVPNEEWTILQQFYKSPFFFSAKAIEASRPVYIELKKIYRQSEQQFIEVLNRIRDNTPTKEDFEFLNSRFDPQFRSAVDEKYITITTHNKRADAINTAELARLPSKLHSFTATINNEFSDKSLPTDFQLQLKPGAQIMFIKNDSSPERRYFNGKIATIKKIIKEEITVSLGDTDEEFVLEKETWKNIRYTYNKEKDKIDEEELGSFTQYPIRLAWAITIHKSQGLTFDKAIIDAGLSFAPGQVYVALSRCTSIQGIVLRSRIYPSAISTDERIMEFAKSEVHELNDLQQLIEKEKYRFWSAGLIKVFDWNKILTVLSQWKQAPAEKNLPNREEAAGLADSLWVHAKKQAQTAQAFQRQLYPILQEAEKTKDTKHLQTRMEKAIAFFIEDIQSSLLMPLRAHADTVRYAGRISKYKEQLRSVEMALWQQLQRVLDAKWGALAFHIETSIVSEPVPLPSIKKQKATRGSSQLTTLELFRQGKTIEEIAGLRNMAISTIENHLAFLVGTGDIDALQLVESSKIEMILQEVKESKNATPGIIKGRLGETVSFHEIRVALNHLLSLRRKQTA